MTHLHGRKLPQPLDDVVGIEPDLVVHFAFLGIAQNVVRFGECFELFFGSLVSGIYIGMMLARKLAKSLANLVCRSSLFDSEDLVIVFLVGGCHGSCLSNYKLSF